MTAFESRKSTALQGLMAPLHDTAGQGLPGLPSVPQEAQRESLEVVMSFQAGVAIVSTSEGNGVISVNHSEEKATLGAAHNMIYHQARDRQHLRVDSVKSLKQILELGHAKDRGLEMMLTLIDGEEETSTRELAGECAEERLKRREVEDFVANRLHRKALPPDADINTALQLARDNRRTRTEFLLREIDRAQPVLTQLGTSLESLSVDVLTRAGWEDHEQAASELADSGVTRSVCRFGRRDATDADTRLLLAEQEKKPQLGAFLAAWTTPLGISLDHSKDQSPQV